MNKKHVLILLVLVVVVGGAGVGMFMRDMGDYQASESRLGKKLLPDLKASDIAQVYVKQGKEELTLVQEGSGWTIKERGGYPADGAQVAEFLLKARDWKVVQSEPIGETQRPRVDLAPPEADKGAATLLELRGKDGKPVATLLLGKKHLGKPPLQVQGFDKGQPDGRYVMVLTDTKNVVVISDPLNNAEPKSDKWMSKEFVKIDRIRSMKLDSGEAASSYELSREKEAGDWVLAGLKSGENTDPSNAVTATNALFSLAFEDLASGLSPDKMEKATTIGIDTFEGWTYQIKVAPHKDSKEKLYFSVVAQGEVKRPERVPGKDEKPEDKDKLDKEQDTKWKRLEEQIAREKAMAKWVYVVERKTLDRVLRERSHFIEKPEPKEPAKKKG